MPNDISVTGYDDSRLARLSQIALTTVGQDTQTITTAAITRAINRLDHAHNQRPRTRDPTQPHRPQDNGTATILSSRSDHRHDRKPCHSRWTVPFWRSHHQRSQPEMSTNTGLT